jgi:hypothetical protein
LVGLTRLPLDRDAEDGLGFGFFGRAGDEQFLLWVWTRVIYGRHANYWLIPNAAVHCTLLMLVPQGRAVAAYRDDNFIRSGFHLSEYLPIDSVRVDDDSSREQVAWSVGDRRYAWKTGEWHLTGTHAGVDLDLTCAPIGPARWKRGPWDTAAERAASGYEVSVAVSGHFIVAGKQYTIQRGYGIAQRTANGEARDIVGEVRAGNAVTTMYCPMDELDLYVQEHPGRGIKNVEVRPRGGPAEVYAPAKGSGSVSLKVTDQWFDPRSSMMFPAKWNLHVASDHGSLAVEFTAVSRSYYHYTTRGGVMMMSWILAVANGAYLGADGIRRPIEDELVGVRWGRELLSADERIGGH